jgi:lipopolysaccharide export system ATP-binding protein
LFTKTRGLQAHDLVKIFGARRAVNGVSVNVAPGEVVALLGRNGAGKSTTFQMIAGLTAPDAGTIRLDGEDVTRRPMYERARRGLTYVPQDRSVFVHMRVIDNVLLPLEERGIPERERLDRAHSLLDAFGLAYAATQYAYALSGGEARKLEVARALATEPNYILLDEPFAGMDPLHVGELQTIIRQLAQRQIGIVLSDHNVCYAFEMADRGYIIDEGRVLEMGSPLALAESPVARSAFLGEDFRVPPSVLGRRAARAGGT